MAPAVFLIVGFLSAVATLVLGAAAVASPGYYDQLLPALGVLHAQTLAMMIACTSAIVSVISFAAGCLLMHLYRRDEQ